MQLIYNETIKSLIFIMIYKELKIRKISENPIFNSKKTRVFLKYVRLYYTVRKLLKNFSSVLSFLTSLKKLRKAFCKKFFTSQLLFLLFVMKTKQKKLLLNFSSWDSNTKIVSI